MLFVCGCGGGGLLDVAPLVACVSLSAVRYSLEALYVGEVVQYKQLFVIQNVDLASHVKDTYGFDIDAYNTDVAVVIVIGLLIRIIGCVVMWAVDKKKKV